MRGVAIEVAFTATHVVAVTEVAVASARAAGDASGEARAATDAPTAWKIVVASFVPAPGVPCC